MTALDTKLSFNETRVLGVLIEKELTTPDIYPLSLNSLTNACNQKSNREPVLDLTETTVQQTVDDLVKKHMATEQSGFGSRVTKIKHRFCNTEFSSLKFSAQELGIICVLFLRGPQTPGELRSRTNRLCEFNDVQDVEAVLINLASRSDGPFTQKLSREPGKRESRWAHLLSGEVIEAEFSSLGNFSKSVATDSPHDRISLLEDELAEMKSEISALKEKLDQLIADLG
jgi:uncharacterized protein YceH (UPF0502 family)